jgi:hypothetical protein
MLHPEANPVWQVWYACKYHGEFHGLESEQPTEKTTADCPTCETEIYPNHASDGAKKSLWFYPFSEHPVVMVIQP